jgi:tripartite-type tricarboxylate transporter receptor subunit TctC
MKSRIPCFTRRRFLTAACAVVAAPVLLRGGNALATYPERTVRIVNPNTPGGPSDIVARLMAAELQQVIGGSVIVENKGGAGGNIGMGYVARAEPDGHTLLLASSAYSVNPSLYDSLPYDPFRDFAPIVEVATSPNVFTVKPELGVSTMKEFVALARTNPDRFNVSTSPIGTTPNVQAEVLKVRENLTNMSTVVFTGGGEAFQALLSGTVQLSSGVLAPAHPHIKSGAVKALAVTGRERWQDLPDVPTMLEAGYDNFVFETYSALLAPAKTPAEIVAQLERESLAILSRPAIREKLAQSGFQVQARNGKAHMERVKREVTMYGEIIKQAGIKLKS